MGYSPNSNQRSMVDFRTEGTSESCKSILTLGKRGGKSLPSVGGGMGQKEVISLGAVMKF